MAKSELLRLTRAVLEAYDPHSTVVPLSSSVVGKILKEQVSAAVGEPLSFHSAFIFLVTSTTAATVRSDPGEGWHTDATCADVNGRCYNTWIPLFSDSNDSGVEVVDEAGNELVYKSLSKRAPLEVYTKKAAPLVFREIADAESFDILILQHNPTHSLLISESDLHISRFSTPRMGDACIFKQTELHRGFHTDGIRIQLSLKFIGKDAKSCKSSIARMGSKNKKLLSKHGLLEADLIRSTLRNVYGLSSTPWQ